MIKTTTHSQIQVAVAPDRTMFTVFANGKLEIRGTGWDRRRTGKEPPGTDKPRNCQLGTSARAKKIANLVAQQTGGLPPTEQLQWI